MFLTGYTELQLHVSVALQAKKHLFQAVLVGQKKKSKISICELLQNKVQFLLQREWSHRPPIELRQYCYPPVGFVPTLPPEKANVSDFTCLRWPVGLK